MKVRNSILQTALLAAFVAGATVDVRDCAGKDAAPAKSTAKAFVADDLTHTNTLGTELFKCYYPANWSYAKKEDGLNTVHEIDAPDDMAWVRMTESPSFSNGLSEDAVVQRKILDMKLSCIPPLFAKDGPMSKYGQSDVSGTVLAGLKKSGAFQYSCFTLKKCPNNFFALIEEFRAADDKHHAGLDLIEKSFEARCNWKVVGAAGAIPRKEKRIYVNANEVLTAKLAERLLGTRVFQTGTGTRSGKVVSISYQSQAITANSALPQTVKEKDRRPGGPPLKIVGLCVYDDQPEGQAAASFDSEKSLAMSMGIYKEANLGTPAFWGRSWDRQVHAPQLFILKDESFIIITIGTAGSDKPDTAGAELLAKAVLARLAR